MPSILLGFEYFYGDTHFATYTSTESTILPKFDGDRTP